jgi:hypothetical protein
MAQATPSISRHTPLTLAQHMTMATMTRAMQLARGAVKEQLKRERIRLAEVEAKEITSRARDFLKTHPALIAEAKLQIEAWFARGVFGKRAQRAELLQATSFMGCQKDKRAWR